MATTTSLVSVSYDWRRDIVESAQRLMQFVKEKQAYVRAQYRDRYGVENAEVKFDIATHSMGGLVARYFLMYGDQDLPTDGSLPELTWAGANYVERVIFVGTPNAGSVEALENLGERQEPRPLDAVVFAEPDRNLPLDIPIAAAISARFGGMGRRSGAGRSKI